MPSCLHPLLDVKSLSSFSYSGGGSPAVSLAMVRRQGRIQRDQRALNITPTLCPPSKRLHHSLMKYQMNVVLGDSNDPTGAITVAISGEVVAGTKMNKR